MYMNEEIVNICFSVALVIWFIVVGKMFCGKICPMGIIQDLFYRIPFFVKIKTFKFDKYLRLLKYVIILINVLLVILLDYQSAYSEGNDRLSVTEITVWALLILFVVILRRPFCKYLCPISVMGSLFNKISFYRYKVSADKCNQCGICSKKCKMDIIPYKDCNSLECILCGCCKKVCHRKAIITGFNIKRMEQPYKY